VVSLATALAVPFTLRNGDAFPKRHSILLLAFTVILVTLVVQGLTLPLLIRLLKIKSERNVLQKEEHELNLELAENSLQFITNELAGNINAETKERLRRQCEFDYKMLSNKKGNYQQQKENETQLNSITQLIQAQMELIKFKRELLIKFRNEDSFSQEALAAAERELDIEELRLNLLMQKAESTADTSNITPEQ
jgi:CPA1 family monovalent cation:H+ antiporter